MADPNFFNNTGPYALSDLCKIGGVEQQDSYSLSQVIDDIAPLDKAGGQQLSFFDNVKYKDQLKSTEAGFCLMRPEAQDFAPAHTVCLLTPSPYKAYALIAQHFYPADKPVSADISERSHIHPSAKIGAGCAIDAGAVIGPNVTIGDNSWIEAHAVIGQGVKVGQGCRIGVSVTVSHAHIGDYTRIYTGARIGQDGFGFAIDPAGHVKVPQLGRVIIEDHVEIGANTTIDRGAGPDTVIGQGTWIDNLVQIGHNVRVGRGCVIVAQVGIAGSTVLEDFVALGGQVGLAGHIRIGMGARVGAQSGVMRDIPPGEDHMGSPSMKSKDFFKQIAMIKRFLNKK